MSNIIFHVVNSVKGGSGKSTFSLLLADYLIDRGDLAYIIDLDMYGSSWKNNYSRYFKTAHGHKAAYINDLMYDLNKISKGYFQELNVQRNLSRDKTTNSEIKVCTVDTDAYFDLDEKEIDLFENVIYNIIKRTYDDNIYKIIQKNEEEGDNKKLHFILDMPPSYEKHADRILSHLLLDTSSPVSKKYAYGVNLYMISSLSSAHSLLNIKYAEKFLSNRSYSNTLNYLIEKDLFRLIFVTNDINALTVLNGTYYTSDNIKNNFTKAVELNKIGESVKNVNTILVKYLNLEYYSQQMKQYMTPDTPDPAGNQCLILNSETISEFKLALEGLSL